MLDGADNEEEEEDDDDEEKDDNKADQSLILSRLTMQGPTGHLFRVSFRHSCSATGTVVWLFLSLNPSEATSSTHDQMVVTAMWFLCMASEDLPEEVANAVVTPQVIAHTPMLATQHPTHMTHHHRTGSAASGAQLTSPHLHLSQLVKLLS